MRRNQEGIQSQSKKAEEKAIGARRGGLFFALLLAAAEALAQENAPASRQPEAQPAAEPARRIVVSIPDRKLALTENGRILRVYRVAVGARVTPSPLGQFKVANRLTNPTWYTPGKVVGPGQDNPLGTRWIGLSRQGYGIHGTNQPGSIGRRASHGCIRMHNRDVEELFELVRPGDVVELHARRTTAIAQIFGAAQAPAPVVPASTPAPVVVATVAGR